MMANNRFQLLTGTVLIWGIVVLCAGVGYAADPAPAQGDDVHRWGRLLALPFYNMTALHGEDTSVRGPLSRQVFVTGKVASEADLFMNKLVERRLSGKAGLAWTMPHDANIAPLRPSTSKAEHLNEIASQGRQRGADHVLLGYLYAFRQRDGGDLGAQTPAKVVFELNVIQAATRRVVWQQRFNETQQALSDNLLNLGKFIRRKGRWIRAHDMAEHAVQAMIDEMFESNPPAIR